MESVCARLLTSNGKSNTGIHDVYPRSLGWVADTISTLVDRVKSKTATDDGQHKPRTNFRPGQIDTTGSCKKGRAHATAVNTHCTRRRSKKTGGPPTARKSRSHSARAAARGARAVPAGMQTPPPRDATARSPAALPTPPYNLSLLDEKIVKGERKTLPAPLHLRYDAGAPMRLSPEAGRQRGVVC